MENKLKLLVFLTLITLSCNHNSERQSESLKRKIHVLEKKVNDYEHKMSSIENSLVIEFDSLDYYLTPITFGLENLENGQIDTFETYLTFSKLPKNIEVKSSILKGRAELHCNNDSSLVNMVTHKWNSNQKNWIIGNYVLTFPNGKEHSFLWGRNY